MSTTAERKPAVQVMRRVLAQHRVIGSGSDGFPVQRSRVTWLASDEGRHITGVALPVDAGFTWSCSACSTVTSYAAKPRERSQTVP
ncbi:MAG: hypothetical protein ABR922_20690 [Streptosporangiaceae bacterium]|jgi:hypothetical protein